MWVEIFIDGFRIGHGDTLSSEGVYASFSNTRRDMKHFQCFVATLFVVPPGVNPLSLMRHVSKDLLKLKRGINVFDSATGDVVTVRGAISMLPADHQQALLNSRSLGNNSTIMGRCCWSRLGNLCTRSVLDSVLEYDMTRRQIQTEVCVDFMLAEKASKNLSSSQMKDLQKRFGVRAAPPVFSDSVEVDTHLQSFWDPSHLFFLNILPRLLDLVLSSLKKNKRKWFLLRMAQFTFARGMRKPARTYRKGLGRSVSITGWKAFHLAAVFACDGLVEAPLATLLVSFWKLFCLALRPQGLSNADLLVVQDLCTRVIQGLLRHGGQKKNNPDVRFFDLPCVHGLHEFCFRTLPALRNGNFSSTASYETHHQTAKRRARGPTREATSLSHWLFTEALVRCMHGMRWGPKQQFVLGSAWTAALKTPLFQALTPFAGMTSCSVSPTWEPIKGFRNDKVDQVHTAKVVEAILEDFEGVCASQVECKLLSGLVKHHGVLTQEFRVDDAVEVSDFGERAFAILTKFVEASWLDNVRYFAFPTWFKLCEHPSTNTLRGTTLLQRYIPVGNADFGLPQDPIVATQIIDRVHIVHSCRRHCDPHKNTRLEGNCRCHPNCSVRTVCKRHEDPSCQDASCSGKTIEKDWHNPDRDLYEVLTKSDGISFEKRRFFYE